MIFRFLATLLLWPAVGFAAEGKSLRLFSPSEKAAAAGPNNPVYIREWTRFTTLDDYVRIGRTNVLWDDDVRTALGIFGQILATAAPTAPLHMHTNIAAHLKKAVDLGCDDPFVAYLHARYALPTDTPAPQFATAFVAAADAMDKSDYSPFRKIFSDTRAVRALVALKDTSGFPSTNKYQVSAAVHMREILQDTNIPPGEAMEALRQLTYTSSRNEEVQHLLETDIFPRIVDNWPTNAFGYLQAGAYYIDKGWHLRGNGFASTVTDEGWRGFEENLHIAEKYLRDGWKADPSQEYIPNEMLSVCLGLGLPRAEMEKWFARAMEKNPNNYDAAIAKAYYLEPKWHGSEKELLAFGRECIASDVWGGRVPRVIRYAHEALQHRSGIPEQTYYARPEVWRDLQASYEKFFKLNPNEVAIRQSYAKDAYRSGQYAVFLDQLAKYKGPIDYEYFGGKAKFDAMVKTATATTSK